eukprot:113793_1
MNTSTLLMTNTDNKSNINTWCHYIKQKLPNKYWLFILSLIYFINTCNASTHICNNINPINCNTFPIQCTPGEPCTIKCTTDAVCRSKIINCPTDQPCEVHCTNYEAKYQCQNIIINAQTSSHLLVNASFGRAIAELHPNPMQDAHIYCPDNGPHDPNQPKSCHINCDGDDLMKKAKIWAVEGFNDVTISSKIYNRDWCYRMGTMNCKQDFSSNCTIYNQPNAIGWECSTNQNNDFTCNSHTYTNSPTESPTTPDPSTYPTKYPTQYPTIAPTTPTKSPTGIPSSTPTLNPTPFPIPTINPSFSPTINPTINPSLSPTIYPTLIPTVHPSLLPTISPTFTPTTFKPTISPITHTPTINPTISPTKPPNNDPTVSPITFSPTIIPTLYPTIYPSLHPTIYPTHYPTYQPSDFTTTEPTTNPTNNPTQSPTAPTTAIPSINPTKIPTNSPTLQTINPTKTPSNSPTLIPSINPTISDVIISTFDEQPYKLIDRYPIGGIAAIFIFGGCFFCFCLFIIWRCKKFESKEHATQLEAQYRKKRAENWATKDSDHEEDGLMNNINNGISDYSDESIQYNNNNNNNNDFNRKYLHQPHPSNHSEGND